MVEIIPTIWGTEDVPDYEALKRRRAIAAALAARQRKFPSTLGEGLTYFGESLGEMIGDMRLRRMEQAQKAADTKARTGGPTEPDYSETRPPGTRPPVTTTTTEPPPATTSPPAVTAPPAVAPADASPFPDPQPPPGGWSSAAPPVGAPNPVIHDQRSEAPAPFGDRFAAVEERPLDTFGNRFAAVAERPLGSPPPDTFGDRFAATTERPLVPPPTGPRPDVAALVPPPAVDPLKLANVSPPAAVDPRAPRPGGPAVATAPAVPPARTAAPSVPVAPGQQTASLAPPPPTLRGYGAPPPGAVYPRGANFMRGQFGKPGEGIVPVNTPYGKIQVHAEAAPAFQGFLADLHKAGAPISSLGSHSIRNIAGTKTISQHAYGNAIDAAQTGRNVVSRELADWAKKNPEALRAAQIKWNIVSGGDWRNPDFGHFEWGGQKPWLKDGGGGAVQVATAAPRTNGATPPAPAPYTNVATRRGREDDPRAEIAAIAATNPAVLAPPTSPTGGPRQVADAGAGPDDEAPETRAMIAQALLAQQRPPQPGPDPARVRMASLAPMQGLGSRSAAPMNIPVAPPPRPAPPVVPPPAPGGTLDPVFNDIDPFGSAPFSLPPAPAAGGGAPNAGPPIPAVPPAPATVPAPPETAAPVQVAQAQLQPGIRPDTIPGAFPPPRPAPPPPPRDTSQGIQRAPDILPSQEPIPPASATEYPKPGAEPEAPRPLRRSKYEDYWTEVYNSPRSSDRLKAEAAEKVKAAQAARLKEDERRWSDYSHRRTKWEGDVKGRQEWELKQPTAKQEEAERRIKIEKGQTEAVTATYEQRIKAAEVKLREAQVEGRPVDIQKAEADLRKAQAEADIKATEAKQAHIPKLTDVQTKDINYFERGTSAQDTLKKHGDGAVLAGLFQRGSEWVPGGRYLQSEEYKSAKDAAKDFLAIVLRKDSGANITDADYKLYEPTFFPMPGDSPQQIKEKSERRRLFMGGLYDGLGTAKPIADEYVQRRRQERLDAAQFPEGTVQRDENGKIRTMRGGRWEYQ
jgi:D-alanyl-D-alanine carboxypeptidase